MKGFLALVLIYQNNHKSPKEAMVLRKLFGEAGAWPALSYFEKFLVAQASRLCHQVAANGGQCPPYTSWF
jgi:hypothetical protein